MTQCGVIPEDGRWGAARLPSRKALAACRKGRRVTKPQSAARLAAQLGQSLPPADSIGAASFDLVAAARRLVEAVVMTDLDDDARHSAAVQIDAVTDLLASRRRDEPLLLIRHPDGRIESLLQAAAGRLNPQALPIQWIHRPTEPPPGSPINPVEVTAECVFGPAHAGSPGRVHGGILALTLDEITGVAVRAAGKTGMTVALDVSLKGAVPLGQAVELRARYTSGEGRKAYATGEIVSEGTLMASAQALYIAERD